MYDRKDFSLKLTSMIESFIFGFCEENGIPKEEIPKILELVSAELAKLARSESPKIEERPAGIDCILNSPPVVL